MINIKDNYIQIDTDNTSCLLRVSDHGDILQNYYGARIPFSDRNATEARRSVLLVNTLYPENDESYGIDEMKFAYATAQRGDIREAALNCSDAEGNNIRFKYLSSHTQCNADWTTPHIPHGWDESLKIVLTDDSGEITAELWYLIYLHTDVIARNTVVYNRSNKDIYINKIASMQLDTDAANKSIVTFNGAWGRERTKKITELAAGRIKFGANGGLTSAECNPFFMLVDSEITQARGSAYAFNLVYSGSHMFSAEVGAYGGIRILSGIADDCLRYRVTANERFIAPYAIMTYTDCGYNGVSANMHEFIRSSIMTRHSTPIMLNTWEAMYFNISKDKVLAIADKAAEIGFEGIVIDDGWFGRRDNDKSSLGDWVEHKGKFKSGLAALASQIHDKGLLFGIWIEPEMVSVDSDLYRARPDWALMNSNGNNVVGRNQYYLDITHGEVFDYVLAAITRLATEYGADYIKWDCNRRLNTTIGNRDAYSYDYALALDRLLMRITENCPNVVIEACASGGGRFDLGMLAYCPCVWTSDNTDPLSRVEIQEGTGYGYPINSMLNHISASPAHQTKRHSSWRTRADVARCGAFGAQMDVTLLDNAASDILKCEIAEYKCEREWLETAQLHRLIDGFGGNDCAWQIMAKDGGRGKVVLYHKRFYTVGSGLKVKLVGLNPDAKYRLSAHNVDVTAHGLTLMNCGIALPQNYQGAGESDVMLNLMDNSTLVIDINRI